MDELGTQTRSAAELSAKAAANEQAKKENELWFSKFVKDIPELDKMLENYSPWFYAIKDVRHKKMCTSALTRVPSINNKRKMNNSKNVNLLMTHTMHENVRPFC